MNVLDTIKLGKDSAVRSYKKNHPFWLKTFAMFGVIMVAGVTYKNSKPIHDAFEEAKKEWKEAQTGKDKATVVVETTVKVAPHAVKIIVLIGGTLYCIEKSYEEQKTQILGLSMMLAGSQVELDDLRAATQEVVGKKKATQIEEKAAQKQFDRMPQDELAYSDCDQDNPDIIEDPETGAVWRDKYINVLDGIASYYTEAKTGSEAFYPWSILYDHINQGKDGNFIRMGHCLNDFGILQSDLKDIKHAQDMIEVIQAGPGRYKLIRHVVKRPNPDGYVDEDGVYWYSGHDDLDYGTQGDWNGSLNPKMRA